MKAAEGHGVSRFPQEDEVEGGALAHQGSARSGNRQWSDSTLIAEIMFLGK
jgi:hypothetical protein